MGTTFSRRFVALLCFCCFLFVCFPSLFFLFFFVWLFHVFFLLVCKLLFFLFFQFLSRFHFSLFRFNFFIKSSLDGHPNDRSELVRKHGIHGPVKFHFIECNN